MSKKKAGRQKKTKKKYSLKTHFKKIFTGLFFLALIVVSAGFLAHYFLPLRQPTRPIQPVPHKKRHAYKIPAYEVYPREKAVPPKLPQSNHKVHLPNELPKVAIIIDDIGYDKSIAKKFISLDTVLTFSVLPNSRFQKEIIKAARKKNFEIMLHLPMEPFEYPRVNPGPGALLTSMSPDRLIIQLNKNLDVLPFIKGVNNHMGSKMTTISTQMYQIFTILKKRDLFFIDSRTTSKSICKPSARLLQIPFAQRDVFLDNFQVHDAIRRQIKHLAHIAAAKGEAIGIGHPHRATYEVLRKELPALKKKVNFVPASALVHING